MMVQKENRGIFLSALLFTLYILAFLLTENAVNACSERFASIDISMAYAVGLFCTAGGYLLFSASRSFVRGQKARKLILLAVSAGFVAAVMLFLLTDNPAAFLCFALLSLLCFGYIGGMVHYNLSMALQGGKRTGRTIGLSIALATLVQMAIENLFTDSIVLIVSVVFCVAVIFYIAVRPPRDWFFENALPYGESVPKKELLIIAGAVLLMSAIMSVNDGIITTLHAKGAVNVLSWP